MDTPEVQPKNDPPFRFKHLHPPQPKKNSEFRFPAIGTQQCAGSWPVIGYSPTKQTNLALFAVAKITCRNLSWVIFVSHHQHLLSCYSDNKRQNWLIFKWFHNENRRQRIVKIPYGYQGFKRNFPQQPVRSFHYFFILLSITGIRQLDQ